MHPSFRLFAALLPLPFAALGCGVILGIDQFTDGSGTGGTGGTGGTSTGGTTTGGGGATGGTTTSGGGGATGGTTASGGTTGGTGGTVCTPGEKQDCYEGTPGTEGIGACKGGQKTCNSNGTGFGGCKGQVVDLPAEDCSTPADDNCNNLTNLQEGCCIANQPTTCYTGPAGTEGVGQCKHANVTCNADGTVPMQCPGQVLPTEEFCATAADEDCNGKNCWVWSDGKGGFANEFASAIATEGFQNRIFVTGLYDGDINFGAGGFVGFPGGNGQAVFLVQYNPNGTIGWAKGFGKNGTSAGSQSVSADSMAGVVVGGYYLFGDIDFGGGALPWQQNFEGFVARYNTDGSFRASRSFVGPGHDEVGSVKITTDGVLVAGDFDSPTLKVGDQANQTVTTAGLSDMFLAKYDRQTDAYIWSLSIGGAGAEAETGAQTMDADFVSGDVYVIGQTATTGLQIGGLPALPAGKNLFLTKVSSAGVPQWAKGYDIPGTSAMIAAAPLGPYLVASATSAIDFGTGPLPHVDKNDIYMAHLDASGNLQWTKTITAMGDQQIVAMAADSSGVVLSGITSNGFTLGSTALSDPGTPSSGAFVVKYDIDGNLLWVHEMGAAAYVALDTPHFTAFAGGFGNSADFGGGAIQSNNSSLDIFVGKLGK